MTKRKNYKQRSTKHTHKTEDRVTRTPLITRVNSDAPEVLEMETGPIWHCMTLDIAEHCSFDIQQQSRISIPSFVWPYL